MVVAAYVGDKEIGLRNEIHANEHIVVIDVGSINDEIAVEITVGQTKVNEIDANLLVATDAHQTGVLKGLLYAITKPPRV